MLQLGCNDIKSYLNIIEKKGELKKECIRLMTVPNSRFFRDRVLWEWLRERFVPELLKKPEKKIRIWSAGCAQGEEAYSFKIIWNLIANHFQKIPALEIIGTDINPEILINAEKGKYSKSSLKEVPEELKTNCFDRLKKQYLVKSLFKENIVWKKHDLLDNPPESDFDIIFLRNNVLTYYQETFKLKAFKKITACLRQEGILIIGSHEKIPLSEHGLKRCEECPFVYIKNH